MARKESAAARARRRRRKTSVWMKAFLGGTLVLVAVVAFAVGNKIVRPFHLWFSEKQAVNGLEMQLAQINHENEALRLKREYLMSAPGAETEARKLGYVTPGEVPVIMQAPKPAPVPHK